MDVCGEECDGSPNDQLFRASGARQVVGAQGQGRQLMWLATRHLAPAAGKRRAEGLQTGSSGGQNWRTALTADSGIYTTGGPLPPPLPLSAYAAASLESQAARYMGPTSPKSSHWTHCPPHCPLRSPNTTISRFHDRQVPRRAPPRLCNYCNRLTAIRSYYPAYMYRDTWT